MSDKELLYQIVNREVSNILSGINPAFRVFSQSISNYLIEIVDSYVDAFTNDDGKIMTNAAREYLKDETNKKIDEYIKKFENDSENNIRSSNEKINRRNDC